MTATVFVRFVDLWRKMFVSEDWRLSTIMFWTLLLSATAFEPLAVSEKDGKFFFCFVFNVF